MDYRAAHCPEENIGSIVNEESPSNGHMTDELELFETTNGSCEGIDVDHACLGYNSIPLFGIICLVFVSAGK